MRMISFTLFAMFSLACLVSLCIGNYPLVCVTAIYPLMYLTNKDMRFGLFNNLIK